MADRLPPASRSEVFWAKIIAASREHVGTAELWRRLNTEAERLGVSYPRGIVQDVNRMRSLASRLAYGSEALSRALPTDAITSKMLGKSLYGRGELGPGQIPAWDVRFQVAVTNGDGTSTGWYRLRYTGTLPATVGSLMDDLDAYTEILGGEYGATVGEVSSVTIGAI